jgi:mRNA interferase MazF
MAKKTVQASQKVAHPQRGDIYLVNFDPTIGSEIQKTRPALIIQNDIANRYSPITIVAAITSKVSIPTYPTEVILEPGGSGLSQRSAALLNQIRSVDRGRLIKHIGRINSETLRRVDQAIQISLGLTGI